MTSAALTVPGRGPLRPTTAVPRDVGPVRSRRRIRRLPAHWPITACIGLFPLWWALGAGALIWPVFAAPLAVRLVTRRRPIRVPMGFGLWLLYLVFVLLSFTALDGGGLPFAYLWRLANYASCTIFFLAIVDATEDEIPSDHVVRLLHDVAAACDLVGLAIAEYLPWEAIATRNLLRKLPLLAG